MKKLLLTLALTLLPGCAPVAKYHPTGLPLVERPDTRRVARFRVERPVMVRMVRHFISQVPKKSAVCLFGRFDSYDSQKDTRSEGINLVISDFAPAALDSATVTAVYWPKGRPHGCYKGKGNDYFEDGLRLLGIGYALELAPHIDSANDLPAHVVMPLSADPRMLFAITFYEDGHLAIRWQDGRTWRAQYATTEGLVSALPSTR